MTAFIYFFISTPNEIQGPSMMPNVLNGDLILTNRVKHLIGGTSLGQALGWDYERGDIIIFKLPGKEAYIKRVIAIPGDSIRIENNQVIVNDKLIVEKYLPDDVITKPGDFISNSAVTVPEGTVIVMGDNRGNSLDSRMSNVGFVERRYIIGPAGLTLFPLNRFGIVKHGEYEEKSIDEVEINDDNILIDLT